MNSLDLIKRIGGIGVGLFLMIIVVFCGKEIELIT